MKRGERRPESKAVRLPLRSQPISL